KLILASVGKLKSGPERALYDHYAGRVGGIGKSVALGPLSEIAVSESRKAGAAERKAEEARDLIARIPQQAVIIAVDEKGKALTSEAFARLLGELRDEGASAVALVLGGPDGHGDELRKKAARTLSLGAITLPHGLAKVVVAEQLYRAATILAGHPYHRS
ncbi:MAG: 23S rRNA (pseudouridine(1915)-N(3))-methyltransferase RlmH, partial [Hyphomicrobiaceae bacterium]|nr:23S rRNA (pseudouridine(1915)-N(3))-methyltransferase RlmH [Hyphomicrobiaceae bacterium]